MRDSNPPKYYAATNRDFSGKDLRGQDFSGQDLSGADFSRARIHSANFTDANLEKAIFFDVRAGLYPPATQRLLSFLFYTSVTVGVAIAVMACSWPDITYWSHPMRDIEWVKEVVEWLEVNNSRVPFPDTFRGSLIYKYAFQLLAVVTYLAVFSYLTAIIFNLSRAVAGARSAIKSGVVIVAVTLIVGTLIALVSSVTLFVVISAGAFATLILRIGWWLAAVMRHHGWLYAMETGFAAVGGTSFRRANLTDANFASARLNSSDLRDATVLRTNWYCTENLDRSRRKGTLLENPAIQDLLGSFCQRRYRLDRMTESAALRKIQVIVNGGTVK